MRFALFQELSLASLVAIYLMSAVIVWFAGTRAAHYANQISGRIGIGGVLIGMVLLGAMTSLPEIATSATAALGGDAQLAIGNLLGGVAFQVVVLAIADAFIGEKALTSTVPNPGTLLQASICILMLALAVAGTITRDPGVFGVGIWSIGIVLAYGLTIKFVHGQERNAAWLPQLRSGHGPDQAPLDSAPSEGQPSVPATRSLVLKLAAVASVIFAAGVVLTLSAEGIAGRTGIESSIVGLTLVAIATSMPEVSTAISSVRLGRNDIAIGDVLGGNLFDVMLIFFVDVLYAGPPALGSAGPVASLAGLIGIILTSFLLIGMIERRNRTIFRMGYDSFLVLIAYVVGITLILAT